MKILQISSYYPPHIGGGDVVVKEISEHLAKKGHEVEVITSNIGSIKNKIPSKKNLTINYCKSIEFAHASIIFSLIPRLLKIQKGTIIHLHVGHIYVPEITWFVSSITKKKYIAHFHLETRPTGKFGFLLPLYKKLILKNVLNKASKVIVPTIDYIEIVKNKYNVSSKNIIVLPNGINTKNFKQINIKEKPYRILFVGRLSTQKNVHTLIKAFKLLTQKYSYLELHIVGDGEEIDRLKSLSANLKLRDNVIFHGTLSGENLTNIYALCDIFAFPSLYESFGIVLIEAMASGLPIVTSNIEAIRNVIVNNKTGLLINPSVEDFTQTINELLKNAELRKKLSYNAFHESKKYEWDRIIPQLENLYKSI